MSRLSIGDDDDDDDDDYYYYRGFFFVFMQTFLQLLKMILSFLVSKSRITEGFRRDSLAKFEQVRCSTAIIHNNRKTHDYAIMYLLVSLLALYLRMIKNMVEPKYPHSQSNAK